MVRNVRCYGFVCFVRRTIWNVVTMITYGYELEVGDVPRSLAIPAQYGTWEYAETDIVNLSPPYTNIAADPLGIEPPVGGEINVLPGRTPEEVADRVSCLLSWFRVHGAKPTTSCVNHGHVHIRVPGLRDDIAALKRMTAWISRNQDVLINQVYGYRETPDMQFTKTARTYLKWDGGRPMPEWMAANIVNNAKDFEDFIRIQCCGKDGISRGRPFRYAINTYCLKHIDTVEFRFFRASLDYGEILGSLCLARDLLWEAMRDGESAEVVLKRGYRWPPFKYDHASYLGWERTKWSKERGHKERVLRDVE